MEFTVTLKSAKVTTNTVRYDAEESLVVSGAAYVSSVYVHKTAFAGRAAPQSIQITVKEVE
jgi:hypothetical protein